MVSLLIGISASSLAVLWSLLYSGHRFDLDRSIWQVYFGSSNLFGSSYHLQDTVPVLLHGPWAIHGPPLAGPPILCSKSICIPHPVAVTRLLIFCSSNMPYFAQIDAYWIPVHFPSLPSLKTFPGSLVSLSACPEHFVMSLLDT